MLQKCTTAAKSLSRLWEHEVCDTHRLFIRCL